MIRYNINQPTKLVLRQNDHNATIVKFEGYTKMYDDTSVYFMPDENDCDHSILLDDDMQMTVQVDITGTVGLFYGTIWEVRKDTESGEWEIMHPSKRFQYEIVKSNELQPEGEATDPELVLIYEQMNQMYLKIKSDYESGAFKGEKGDTGEQGPQGIPGIVIPANGMFSFTIVNNDLNILYNDADEAPDLYIDSDGHLIFGKEEVA